MKFSLGLRSLSFAFAVVIGLSGLALAASDICDAERSDDAGTTTLSPSSACLTFTVNRLDDPFNKKEDVTGTRNHATGDCDGQPTNC